MSSQVLEPAAVSDDDVATPAGNGRRARGAVGFVGQVLAWLTIMTLLGALVAAVLVPRLVGGSSFTVLTGSMTPTYPPGTLIVTRPVDPAQVRIGSVVTFQIASGRPEVVTHRVTAVRTDADSTTGELEFQTKGDANNAVDPEWRPAAAIRGELWYAVPHLGRVDGVISGEQRQLAVYAVAALLVGYAGVNLAHAGRDRARRGTTGRHRG